MRRSICARGGDGACQCAVVILCQLRAWHCSVLPGGVNSLIWWLPAGGSSIRRPSVLYAPMEAVVDPTKKSLQGALLGYLLCSHLFSITLLFGIFEHSI